MKEIMRLDKQGLKDFINSAAFAEMDLIPISKHRAISQLGNPELEPDDVILILSMVKNRVAGYVGILPMHIFLRNGNSEKMGCLTSIWVNPQMRGQGIASRLIKDATELWKNKCIGADYVEQSKPVYLRSGYYGEKPFQKQGIRLYILADFETLLPPKNPFFDKIKSSLRLIDWIANGFLKTRLRPMNSDLSELHFTYPEKFDNSMGDFVTEFQKNALFRRGKDELNHILENPWVISRPRPNTADKEYYFSTNANSFENRIVNVFSTEGELLAILYFTFRDGSLKLPYLYYKCPIQTVAQSVIYHVLLWKVKMFTTFHSPLANELGNIKTPGFYKKEVKRNYLISNALKDCFFEKEPVFQDGDGDCVFT